MSSTTAVIGKDAEGKAGDRVLLTTEGRNWCELHYPDWLSDCQGTITRYWAILCIYLAAIRNLINWSRVDKDGRMCDVKWDDRDRLYHYHTVRSGALFPRAVLLKVRAVEFEQGCFGLFHLALVRAPERRCAYLGGTHLRPSRAIGKSSAAAKAPSLRRRFCGRPPLLLMR